MPLHYLRKHEPLKLRLAAFSNVLRVCLVKQYAVLKQKVAIIGVHIFPCRASAEALSGEVEKINYCLMTQILCNISVKNGKNRLRVYT